MSSETVYFRQNVQVEPLFNNWYALPNLIPPVNAAMYIANSHLKIMQSFIEAPESHASALKNPAMSSGPFINHPSSKVGEIKALAEKTVRENSHMLELARAVKTLDETLMREARGYSLEPLYKKMPDILKGYVEVFYDFHNRPSLRFLEALIYKSRYYNAHSQSLALSSVLGDGRPFVLSTPRLEDEKTMHLKIPFSHEGLDELFRMKVAPQSYEYIKERLGLEEKDDALFSSFFTQAPPEAPNPYCGDDIRIRYFGHACVLIESKNVSILIDPLISYKYDAGIYRYTFADLPDQIDYVLITHAHQDHFMFETLLQLRSKIKHLIVPKSAGDGWLDPSLKLLLKSLGFRNVTELDELESIEIEGGEILGVPFLGEHADLNIRTKIAHLVRLHGKSMLMAADSNNVAPALYRHLHDLLGDVDVLFIGMECDGAPLSWMCGPLFTQPPPRQIDQARRFDGSGHEKGLEIVRHLNVKQAYVYAMGAEPWLTFMTSLQYTEESRPILESNQFIRRCREMGVESERLFGHKEIILPAKLPSAASCKRLNAGNDPARHAPIQY
jgi:L-ascorbate metabolism protein UlaG (beta-lactamase superfamily)